MKDDDRLIHDYYRGRINKAYYGGAGVVRMFIAITFLIVGVLEPEYEPVHRALAIAFGLYIGAFGLRAFLRNDVR